MIRRRRLTYIGHVTRMEERLPARALYSNVEGTRSRGRQAKTWMDNVKQDLKDQNLEMRNAGNITRDRSKWRGLAKTSSSAT